MILQRLRKPVLPFPLPCLAQEKQICNELQQQCCLQENALTTFFCRGYFNSAPAHDEYFSVMMATKEIRNGFLRKVYGTLSIQLLVTFLVCALAMKVSAY
jgi:hypothetical protein